MENWLNKQAQAIAGSLKGDLIALDGKSLRGKKKFETSDQNTHTLNVFATKLGIALSQKSIPEKTNEMGAMYEILDDLDIEGTTISIDAIGCQKEMTKKIILKGGEYILALKANQKSLLSDVGSMFDAKKTYFPDVFEEHDKGHGRIESRKSEVLNNTMWLQERHPEWENLKSVIKVTSIRDLKDKETSTTVRYYISSQIASAQEQLERTRRHWGIENNLHWILDVQFKEDDSLIRKNNAAENMAAVRKMALNIIKNYKAETGKKRSTNGLRKNFGWREDVMTDILNSWINKCS